MPTTDRHSTSATRPLLIRTQQEALELGWQQITFYAAAYMESAPELWAADSTEEVRTQARRLAAAQWFYYARHINEFCGGAELR